MSLRLPADLTVAQDAIWRDQQLFPGRPIYNTGQVLSIEGELRFDLFERALRATVAESPCLRLAPRSAPFRFELPLLDFRDDKNPLNAAEQWIRDEMSRAIPLDDSVLFRFALLSITSNHTLWFQKYHHIIMDATARRLVGARTAERYRALRFGESLSVLNAYTPEELLEAERHYNASPDHEVDRIHWLKRFTDWPEPLLGINRQNTERARSGCHARTALFWKRADFNRFEQAARRFGSSAFRAIIALTYAAFARLYDRSEICLGVQLAYRSDQRAKQVIGLLARPLPMLLKVDHSTAISDAIRQIDEVRAQDYPHRFYPLQELVTELGILRKGHHNLYDAVINYIPARYDFSFEEIPAEVTNLSYGFTAPWVVTIADTSDTRDLAVTIDTDPGLIAPDLAARLASSIETLLLRGLGDAACPIAALPIMPEESRAQVLAFAAGPSLPVAPEATLTSLCAAQARRTPEAAALISEQEQLSFAALHERAELLARRLAALGVRPGVVVGIALPREPSLVIAVLAVHKAGGAYLALDPSYPIERIRFMVADSAAPVIVTTAALAPSFADSGAKLLLDSELGTREMELADPISAGPTDLAYVLYTSGSTGRPKAVGIEHRNIVNLISWGRSVVSDSELGGILFSTSLNFDLSAFEMFLPLALGGTIVLLERFLALPGSPLREQVRLINTGPSLLDALLRSHDLPRTVTTVILAGERLSRHLASSVFEVAPTVRLLNFYGPTETTVYSSWAVVDRTDRAAPSIGRPIWNTTLYVLDSGHALVPPGADGELYIGGAGVARGYLGRPELTAERFIPNPHGEGKLYRTGDRVRWRQDGELDFLGRVDEQIKNHGVRIEPGEIEAYLLAIPGIDAAAVTLHGETLDMRRLTAYLVKSSAVELTTEEVRATLERRLPHTMVPSAFVWLHAMPLTPNGKLDRKALPAPPRDEVGFSLGRRPPRTRLERELAEIWKEVLAISEVSVQSDFFEVGGDSLALLNLFAVIESRFGRRLTVDALSGGLTIVRLAQLLSQHDQSRDSKTIVLHGATFQSLVPLRTSGTGLPFFLLGHFPDLINNLKSDRPVFSLHLPPLDGKHRIPRTIESMAANFVTEIRRVQPHGPYFLGGYSFGGRVSFEIAQQLVDEGEHVSFLGLIDTVLRDTSRPPEVVRLSRKIRGVHSFRELISRGLRYGFLRGLNCMRHIGKLGLDLWLQLGCSIPYKYRLTYYRWLYDRANRAGVHKPYPGRITMFSSAGNSEKQRANWGALARGGLTILEVPAGHFDMIRPPYNKLLANHLDACLDVATRGCLKSPDILGSADDVVE